MRKAILIFLSSLLMVTFFITGWFLRGAREGVSIIEPIKTPTPTPLSKYEIEKLSSVEIPEEKINIVEESEDEKDFKTYSFEYNFDPTLSEGEKKTTTGLINVPKKPGEYPVVFMIRGYVDPEIYVSGVGTRNAGRYFAENGYITIAPDFLGYAGSDSESGDIFETRFQTYTTVLRMINSIQRAGVKLPISGVEANNKLFIWAHSNGGQIALTFLSVTGKDIPTTLWAPVTKPFPYSILYYTDESIDGGKFIRSELAKFESLYDVDLFSFTNYLNNINAPLQFQQGGSDDAVPLEWTSQFVTKLKADDKNVELFTYPLADHNMRPNWDEAVKRDVDFFVQQSKN